MSEKLVAGGASLINQFANRLTAVYGVNEARSVAAYLLEGIFDVSVTNLLTKELVLSAEKKNELEAAILRLQNHEPVQHVVGYSWFYGRKFRVNKDVLVPRPETEELVHWIVKTHSHDGSKTLLDIGTGSGCIPVTVQLEAPAIACVGCDISEAALAVARHNAETLGATVNFKKCDILKDPIPEQVYDIIASNPPYVRQMEKGLMDRNVLEFDPELALFVPNDDPLIFYKRISEQAAGSLKSGGWLFFEINEAFGTEVVELLKQNLFMDVTLKNDLNGKSRMIRGRKPSGL